MIQIEKCVNCTRGSKAKYQVDNRKLCGNCCPKRFRNEKYFINKDGTETNSTICFTPSRQRFREVEETPESRKLKEIISSDCTPMKFSREISTQTHETSLKTSSTNTEVIEKKTMGTETDKISLCDSQANTEIVEKNNMSIETDQVSFQDSQTSTYPEIPIDISLSPRSDENYETETAASPAEEEDLEFFSVDLEKIGKDKKLNILQTPSEEKDIISIWPYNTFRKNVVFVPNLAPENLGPFTLPNGEVCSSLKNLWEFSKISEKYLDIKEKTMIESVTTFLTGEEKQEEMKLKDVFFEIRKLGLNSNIFKEQFGSVYYFDEKVLGYLFLDKENKSHLFTPQDSSLIYFYFCEKIMSNSEDFKKLLVLRKENFNIEIVGSRSSSHISVLYYMLKEEIPSKFPWNIEIEQNEKVKNFLEKF